MKVRLTNWGVPFGRVMNYEIAQIYFEQTKHAIKGISCVVVMDDER